MSIWAEIKKSLNSTLGTSSFKSLDGFLSDILTLIGNTDDEQGTTIKGTIMGKLNAAYAKGYNVELYTKYSENATRTGYLSSRVNYIMNNLLGYVDDTGGTSAAGTVMAKLNKILSTGTGSSSLVASNTVRKTFVDTETRYEASIEEMQLGTILITKSGSIRLRVHIKFGYASSSRPATMNANLADTAGNPILSIDQTVTTPDAYGTYNFDFRVTPGMGAVKINFSADLDNPPSDDRGIWIDTITLCYDESTTAPDGVL